MPIDFVSDPPRTAGLVVVGGGVIGAATAFHASRAGLAPLLIERRPALCTLTTAAAAGGFRLQLDDEEEFRLVAESVDMFVNFAEITEQKEYDPNVRQAGYLWATTDAQRAAAQRSLVDVQRSWGLNDVDVLGGYEVRREFPFITPEVIQARFRAGDGLIDPKALTFGLVAGSRAQVVPNCGVVGFHVRGDRLIGVETTAGLVSAEAAVIAAGPLSGPVAATAGVDLPITTVRRQKVVMPGVPEVPSGAPMTIDDDSGAHWRPAFGGAFLLFTDPATSPTPPEEDVPVDHGFALRLLDPRSPVSVARVTPFWRTVWDRGDAHWMLQAGQYTMTPDRRPLLGPTPVQGLYANTGYSGRGVMSGPAGSRHLIDVVTGKVGADENPYRLDRSFEERHHLDPL